MVIEIADSGIDILVSNMADSLITPTSRQSSKTTGELKKNSTTPLNQVKKLQCDLCKLSYPQEKELTEHLVSLMHHNKMEDKVKDDTHYCCLCGYTCFAMSEYRTHIATEKHQKKLSALREENTTGGKPTKKKNNRQKSSEFPDFHQYFPRSRFSKKYNNSSSETYPSDKPYGKHPRWQESEHDNQRFNRESRGWLSGGRGNNRQHIYMEYEPWGSGKFRNYPNNSSYRPYTFYFRGNGGGRIVSKERNNNYIDFTSDDWDDESLNNKEQYLADMSHEPFYSPHLIKFEDEEDRHARMMEVNGRDRKRPRNEDDIEESLPKSSKSNTKSSAESSYLLQADRLDGLSLMPFTESSMSSSKMSITDASDSILEKAERLCKELRHKSLEDKFSKTNKQDRVSTKKINSIRGKNDVQNKYAKNISNSLEQHSEHIQVNKNSFKNMDSVSKSDDSLSNKVSKDNEDKYANASDTRAIPTSKQSANIETMKKSPPHSSSQSKQEKCSSSPTRWSTASEVIRPSSSSELLRQTTSVEVMSHSSKAYGSSKQSGSLFEQQSKNRQRSLSAEYGSERNLDLQSTILQKPTAKSISKDHLQKLVNAPRSRDERLQLAKMLQSREEHRSSTVRSNLQLEGLYDSELGDANLDLDNISNETTIKVEDMSDGLRQQLIELIGEDIRAIFDNAESVHITPPGGVARPAENDRLTNVSSSPIVPSETTFSDPQGINVPLPKKKKKITVPVNAPTDSTDSTKFKPTSLQRDFKNKHSKNLLDKESTTNTINIDFDHRKINSDKRSKPGFSVETEDSNITSNVQRRSPVKDVVAKNSPVSSTAANPSNECSDLNRDNVNVRYPTIMDITRSDRAQRSCSSPASLQAPNSPSLSRNQALSTAGPSAASPDPCSSSSALSQSSAELVSSHKQLSLPPSRWLAERESVVTNTLDRAPVDNNRADLPVREGLNSNTLKPDNPVIEISEDTEYAPPQPSDTVPVDLLRLSERDEEIKQEMVSLDLRLTRLHRLLEQAVFQITKCTERRTKLLEETQDISNKRITLLRETAAVRFRGATKESSPSAKKVISPSNESTGLAETSDGMTSARNGNTGVALSKEDWLAKFSSFLPTEPLFETRTSRTISSESSRMASGSAGPQEVTSILQNDDMACQSMGTRKNDDTVPFNSPIKRHQSMDQIPRQTPERLSTDSLVQKYEADSAASKNGVNKVTSSAQPVIEPHPTEFPESTMTASTFQSISNIFSRPLVYLGSFKSAETLPMRTPVIMLNDSSNVTQPGKGNNTGTSGSFIHSAVSRAVTPHAANEDSEPEGSVCTGSASESSLGERISRYCQNTPEASLGSMGQAGSSVSIQKKKKKRILVRPCSVSLCKVDDILKETHCTLDKKTAEALHLLERNSPNDGPDSSINGSKKKKMLTRHERVFSGIRRRMRQRILSESSSSDEAGEDLSNGTNYNRSPTGPIRSQLPAGGNKNMSLKSSKKNPTVALKELMKAESSPSKATSVVIAECDSSTHIGVDKESFTQRLKSLKEMRENFDKAFGHSASSTVVSKKDVNISLLSDPETFPGITESSYTRNKTGLNFLGNLRPVENKKAIENSLEVEEDLKDRMSCFPGNYGPVVDLHVLNSDLYVAYHSHSVSIYSLNELNKNAHDELMCPGLLCMAVVQWQGLVKVITGCGFHLLFFIFDKDNNNKQVSYDMGTPVKCLSVQGSLVYCGLETGEICVFDTTKTEIKDRYICSDYPIHCLAFAQEGSSRLICASSQDGTIIVINALTGLPLRILTGHSKTAFSLAVQGQLVFSGSGDSTVMAHNIHTGAITDIIKDNKGLVKTVFYHQGFLFTGGMDRLVRCYDIKKNCKLTQVYYGADRSVICKILVHNNMLITGNTTGAVDCVQLDLQAQNLCHKNGCDLNFGSRSHLFWHILEDHNITGQKKEPIVLN